MLLLNTYYIPIRAYNIVQLLDHSCWNSYIIKWMEYFGFYLSYYFLVMDIMKIVKSVTLLVKHYKGFTEYIIAKTKLQIKHWFHLTAVCPPNNYDNINI